MHTPTPWQFNKYGTVIDENGKVVMVNGFGSELRPGRRMEEAKANARLILRSVNANPELVKELVKALEAAREFVQLASEDNKSYASRAYDAVNQIDAALSIAKGEGK